MEETVFRVDDRRTCIIRESNDGKQRTVEVHLSKLPTAAEYEKIFDEVREAVTEDIEVCQIRLERLEYCDSKGLGMWLSLDAAIRDHGGRCEFWVSKNSRLHQILCVTRLDKILNVCLLELKADQRNSRTA